MHSVLPQTKYTLIPHYAMPQIQYYSIWFLQICDLFFTFVTSGILERLDVVSSHILSVFKAHFSRQESSLYYSIILYLAI